MKRAPIVLTGTACGLVAVIGYHTAAPQASALSAGASGAATSGTLNVGGTGSSSASANATAASPTSSATATTAKSSAATTAKSSAVTPATTRSATGSDVQYQFGDIEVKVTMTGSRITDVAVVKADVYDQRSAQIDQYAIPQLRSQALSAQSAHIDGISGASYTSAAYEQSLQSAIDKLKA